MYEHLGYSDGDITHVQHGEDSQGEVHGYVEAGVQVNQGDNEPIARKCREVEEKKDVEEDYINF